MENISLLLNFEHTAQTAKIGDLSFSGISLIDNGPLAYSKLWPIPLNLVESREISQQNRPLQNRHLQLSKRYCLKSMSQFHFFFLSFFNPDNKQKALHIKSIQIFPVLQVRSHQRQKMLHCVCVIMVSCYFLCEALIIFSDQ